MLCEYKFLRKSSSQGEENLANLTRLIQHLSDDNKAVLEMNILQDIFNKSFFADKEVDIKVFDSAAFLDKLATLTGKDGQKAIFQSKAAKEFLKMVDDFHTLFKKDADIARRISPARSNNPFGNSNFATTASGKLAMLRIKLLFEVAMRNMPDVFWLPANWTNAFKSAALKYHLEHALARSNTISEFKTNFTHNVKRSQHTPQTQRLIKQITQGLDGLEKDAQELAKMSDDEIIKKEMSDTFGVVYKGKNAALIYKDLQNLENAILLEKGDKNKGGTHIRLKHTKDTTQQGFVTPDEVENIGQNVRKYLKEHKEPFIDKDGARLYEWQDEQGVNFRLVVRDKVSGADALPTSANEEIITFYSNRNLKDSTNFEFKNPSVAKSYETKPKETPTAQSTPQAPQKSLLEQARENTERLRAAQEAEQIAQKEAELARLKEMQAKNAEILAQKEAAAGQAINEAQSLEIGTPIKAHKISDTKIIINDNTAPFKAEFIIAKKDDIKPNFERTGTQGRSERQDKVIESIQSDFKPHLIFEQMGGFEGLPIILKDGQVIAGNHRAQAIKGLTGENLARYKQAAKEKFGVDLKDDEVIVRLVKDGDEKELINLAFMSNVGRESNLGEKALANLAKYDSQIQTLPNHINADSVFELESQVAKALDTQGNGLNVFDTNLALFSRLAKSTQNANILDSLNALKNLSQDEKEKVLRMFVSNAGEFHNLAKDTELKSLNLNNYLADALIVAAKNVDSTTRAANYAKLLDDIITMQASAKEQLKIDPFLFENFKSKALGYALARFARLENPSAKLFEFLKASKADLENLYTGNIFESNKAISDIDIYDFLKHAINSGEDLIDKQGRNIKGEITSRLDDLRKVENALIDSGEIQFAKSKIKPQGREAKETSINSLFADDELQMQATKPAKELNLSDEKDFNELGEFFKLNSKDKEFNEIFAKATKAAQRLGVKVKFDESAARSHFILNDNTITIAAANKGLFQAQDLLHELIHATTRKALKDFNFNPEQAAKIYTKKQIEAIKEINSLYLKSKGIAKRQGKDIYALQNVDEFVAELSSSEFRAFLKAQDIFERFIKALIRFFTGDSERLAKNVNSYKALKESYYKILDDYEPPLAPQKIADERALKSVDELNSFETTPTTQDIKQTLQNNKGQLLIKDEKGKNHFINEKLVKAWQDEFKLANAQDDFLPEFSPQIKDILAKNGVDEIHLKIGSLVKINARDRGEFIKHIKPTLQEPDFILKDESGVLFVKDIGKDKAIFTSIAKNENGEWIISTNSYKRIKTLKDKIESGNTTILHQSKEASNQLVEAFTNTPFRAELDKANSSENLSKSQADENKQNALSLFNGDEKALDEYIKELNKDKRYLAGSKFTMQTQDGKEIIFSVDNHKTLRLADEKDFEADAAYHSHMEKARNDHKNAHESLLLHNKEYLQKQQSIVILHKQLDKIFNSLIEKYPYDFEKFGFDDILKYKTSDKLVKEYQKIDKIYNKIKNEKNTMLNEFIAKNADESQVLSAYDKNVLENAPKETIEAHLKSIEKDIDYLEKGIDFYKKNPEQDYNGEMVKFNEKLLTPKLQMQKAYKQRLDELNSLDLSYAPKRNADEVITKSQVDFTKRIKKVQNYATRINDEIGSGEFYNSLTREQKDKLYNAFLFKDKNLKNKGDFRIDDNYIYMNEKSTPEQISHALNVFLETEKIVDKSRPAFYETLKKYPKFNSKKVNDLLEFMKESDNFTKDKNGVPKEFFHGGGQNIKIFNNDESGYGYFFSSVKDEAKAYSHDKGGGFYKVFLQMKKPFRMDKITINSFDEYKNTLQNLGIKDITKDDYEIFLENKRFFNEIKQKAQENGFKLSEMDYSNATFINKNQAYNIKLYNDRTYPAISNLFKDIKPLNDGDIWFGFNNFARNEFDLALLSVDNKGIAEYDKIHAEFVGNLKDILQKQGYDSIIFNDFQVSVFNPNQIKEVKNTGSWTDSAGKITKEKPSDESARHSYFNAQSPNILHSNEIWGGGLAGGTLNGLETDEDGNIIGFDPAKFVAGFIAGAAGTKAVKSQFAKKYATITSDKIKKSVQNALENLVRTNEKVLLQNPQGFIKKLDKKGIAELLNSKGNIKMSVGDGKAFKADEVALNLPQNVSKMERKGLNFLAIL